MDQRVIGISDRSLSEKAFKAYLILCRRDNPKRNLGCSFSGAHDFQKLAGIPKNLYDKTIQELINKHLIAIRPEVKAGYFKSVPLEVLSFPDYDAQKRTFKKHKKSESTHRKYGEGTQYINLPSLLLDNGFLISLNSVETLLNLIKLYHQYDYEEFGGVDFRLVHTNSVDNPSGYIASEKKGLSNVSPFTHWKTSDQTLNFQCLNSLVKAGLVSYTPTLIYQDPLDPELTYRKKVVFQKLDSGIFSFPTPPEHHQVIWVLQLLYQVKLTSSKKLDDVT